MVVACIGTAQGDITDVNGLVGTGIGIGKGTSGTDRNHIIADDAVAAGSIREGCTAGVESCRRGAVVCLVAGRDAAADNQRLGIYCQCVGC